VLGCNVAGAAAEVAHDDVVYKAHAGGHKMSTMSGSDSGSKPKRQGSILPFVIQQADAPTRLSAGQLRSEKPCVFCVYSCTPRDPDTTSMADIEHSMLLDSVLRFYALNCETSGRAGAALRGACGAYASGARVCR